MDEGCHQDLAEVCSDAEPETSTKGHEMLRSSGDFHLALLKRMPDLLFLEKLASQDSKQTTLLPCPASLRFTKALRAWRLREAHITQLVYYHLLHGNCFYCYNTSEAA